MKNKGQALVEFILVVPILLILIFGIIDVGRVIYAKNNLENKASDAALLYKNGKSINEIENELDDDIKISVTQEEDKFTIILKKSIEPITPGVYKIMKDAFDIETKRVIYNE